MIPPGKRRSVRLSANFVRTVDVPGRYGDGYLLVDTALARPEVDAGNSQIERLRRSND